MSVGFLGAAREAILRLFPSGTPLPGEEPEQRAPGDRKPRTPGDRDKRRTKRKAARAARRKNRR